MYKVYHPWTEDESENVKIDFLYHLTAWAEILAADQGFWDGTFRSNSGGRLRRPLDPLMGEMAPFYFDKNLQGKAGK